MKSKTKNINSIKILTTNERWRISAQCLKCKTNKSKFIKSPIEKSNTTNNFTKKLTEQEQLANAQELHKSVSTNFPKRKIITEDIDDLWVADLVIMRNYSEENSGYLYMLNVIDTFSKFAWVEPLRKKDGKNVTKGFEEILKRAKQHTHNPLVLLHTDKGTDFVNKQFKEMFEKYNIKMYQTQNEEKSSIIERFNRTLNGKMKIQFEVQENKRWIE